jgi:hypothetical protein
MMNTPVVFLVLANGFLTTSYLSADLGQAVPQSHSSFNTIKVGIVRDQESFDGAGCSLQLPADNRKHNERYVFRSDYEDNAVLNINGKDARFKLVSHREPQGNLKKGQRSTWSYTAEGIHVRVDYVVIGVCDPNDESCEVTYYDATITVTHGNDKQVVKAKGSCGS